MNELHDDNPKLRPRRRFVRWLSILAGVAVLGAVSSEGFLRWRYGLGNPPVMLTDPKMEYRYAPDGHYMRRGNHIDINHYSMRSDDFAATKSSPAERRVIFIGDSVINGGAQTDQSQLATAILQSRLRKDFGVPAFVGNISAGSWGPQNELAYIDRFGLLQADVVVVVVSSHDATDEIGPLPPDERIGSAHYTFAWQEVADRLRGTPPPTDLPMNVGKPEPCLAAFDAMLTRITTAGAVPMVVFHYERHEIDEPSESTGHALLRTVCDRHGIKPVELKSAFAASLAAGRDPYRDYIHPNLIGQQVMADALTPVVESALRSAATQPATRSATRP